MSAVNIYVPTYRNEVIFNAVLDSYLNQTFENIKIHIFDNSFADGFEEIQSLVEEKKDKRIVYIKNNYQMGAAANYWQAINSIDYKSKAMLLAADMGLAPNAIEVMLRNIRSYQSHIVMPATREYPAEIFYGKSQAALGCGDFNSLSPLDPESTFTSSTHILERYFGNENISGEFFKFSFLGCLFDGGLIRHPPRSVLRFGQHGFEQYISMSLLVSALNVLSIPDELLYNIYGAERLGGTERLGDDLGRIECILACQMILDEHDFYLSSRKVDIVKMRKSQIQKAIYFKSNFTGYEGYADEIIAKNKKYIHETMIFA